VRYRLWYGMNHYRNDMRLSPLMKTKETKCNFGGVDRARTTTWLADSKLVVAE
jgi:hypothetical protein